AAERQEPRGAVPQPRRCSPPPGVRRVPVPGTPWTRWQSRGFGLDHRVLWVDGIQDCSLGDVRAPATNNYERSERIAGWRGFSEASRHEILIHGLRPVVILRRVNLGPRKSPCVQWPERNMLSNPIETLLVPFIDVTGPNEGRRHIEHASDTIRPEACKPDILALRECRLESLPEAPNAAFPNVDFHRFLGGWLRGINDNSVLLRRQREAAKDARVRHDVAVDDQQFIEVFGANRPRETMQAHDVIGTLEVRVQQHGCPEPR